MSECFSMQRNMVVCTCTYEPCPRKGNCCACIQYHWPSKEMPGCMFPAAAERKYDRSLRHFLQCYAKG